MEKDKKLEVRETKIAKRVPPGDRWQLVNPEIDGVIEGLTNALERYLVETSYRGDYLLKPLKGELCIYEQEEVELEKPTQTFDLYGEK